MGIGRFAKIFGLGFVVIMSGVATLGTDQAQAARKSCWVDHYHSGGGSGTTRRRAKQAAVRSWESFTAMEYGAQWGHYKLAKDRRLSCSGVRGDYECNVSAIPCHRLSSS